MVFFGGFFYAPLTRPFIDTLSFWWIKVQIWWYISGLNFIYVWFVVPKFSNFKRIRSSRKVDFRLLLGGFLTILPPNAVNSFEILTSHTMRNNASDMSRFLLYCQEIVEIEPKNWISGSFLDIFRLRPLTPYELRRNFLRNESSHEDTKRW